MPQWPRPHLPTLHQGQCRRRSSPLQSRPRSQSARRRARPTRSARSPPWRRISMRARWGSRHISPRPPPISPHLPSPPRFDRTRPPSRTHTPLSHSPPPLRDCISYQPFLFSLSLSRFVASTDVTDVTACGTSQEARSSGKLPRTDVEGIIRSAINGLDDVEAPQKTAATDAALAELASLVAAQGKRGFSHLLTPSQAVSGLPTPYHALPRPPTPSHASPRFPTPSHALSQARTAANCAPTTASLSCARL